MDLVTALTRLGGTSSRAPLLRMVTRRALITACGRGEVLRVGHDAYALPGVDEARLAAARLNGVVSHLSAARAHGWKVKRLPRVPEVTVGRHRSRVEVAGIQVAYGDVTAHERSAGLTSPVRTVIDCARRLPFDEALAVADSALRSGAVTRDELETAARACPRTGRAKVVRVARAANPGSANPFESVLRAIALDVPGLQVVAQVEVPGIGHADVGDPELRIAIEAESFEFHALHEAFSYDVRRYTAMVRAGWLVVRFTWDDVMHRPAYVRAVLADLVRLRSCQQDVRRSRR